jgi:hypothetical protein
MEKQCKKCEQTFLLASFPRNNRNKDGYDLLCKICRNNINREYRLNNDALLKEARKKYYQANLEKMRLEKKGYYAKNTLTKKQYDAYYRVVNKKRIQDYKKSWEEKYRQKIEIRIKQNLRRRIIHVLKGESKSESSMKLLGCTIEFFMTYLESMFDTRMNWDNYGQFGWHIDHIKPCYAFDLRIEDQQKLCFHYTNLRPLWWKDNLEKSKKYEP